jgi:hypothetical protein
MLQRSLLTSSLLKQAAAKTRAQQFSETRRRCEWSGMRQAASDSISFPLSPGRISTENLSLLPVPTVGKKYIRFNEQVEQFIALEMEGDEIEIDSNAIHDYGDSDSDDGVIMMTRTNSKRRFPLISSRETTQRAGFSPICKMTATLPSATLKYSEDAPELPNIVMKHSQGFQDSGKLPLSFSQKTLMPSKVLAQSLLEDNLEGCDACMDSQSPSDFSNFKDNSAVSQERLQDHHESTSSSSLNRCPSSIRRTLSGMFVPYEEDEDDVVWEGLLGKVVDMINTARDTTFIFWNVGWR